MSVPFPVLAARLRQAWPSPPRHTPGCRQVSASPDSRGPAPRAAPVWVEQRRQSDAEATPCVETPKGEEGGGFKEGALRVFRVIGEQGPGGLLRSKTYNNFVDFFFKYFYMFFYFTFSDFSF